MGDNQLKKERDDRTLSQRKLEVHIATDIQVAPNGGRNTDLKEMVRLPLLPGTELPGLVQGLEVESHLTAQLRPYLQADISYALQDPQVAQHQLACDSLREVERWMLEAHARLLKAKAGNNFSETRSKKGDTIFKNKNILPFCKTTRDILNQQSVHTGMLINKKGKLVLAEYPDPVGCEHLQSLMDNSTTRSSGSGTQNYDWLTVEKKIKFAINPSQIIFKSYVLGQTYHSRLVVQNAGSHSAGFSVRGPCPGGVFSLSNVGYRGQVLAPGLSATLAVSFHCRDKEDHSDTVTIISGDTQYVVPISSKMDPPTLFSQKASSQIVDGISSTVDCGRCFVGYERRLRLILVNTGPTARFFFISEDDWIKQSITHMRQDLTVLTDSFAVRPAYLRLERWAEGELEIGFLPSCEGSHVSRLYVLCDNATVRHLDLTGDARTYCPEILSFQGFEKSYNIGIQDDIRAHQFVYLGKVLPKGVATGCFRLQNHSPMEIKFSWEERETTVQGGQRGVFGIEPPKGIIPPDGSMLFQTKCMADRLTFGRHLALFTCSGERIIPAVADNECEDGEGQLANVYINDVPLAAFPEKYLSEVTYSQGSEEGHPSKLQKVAIEHSTLEVWVDVIEPEVVLLDNYIHIFTFPQTKCRAPIYLTNFSLWEMVVQWDVPKGDCWQMQVIPQTATIPPVATSWFKLIFTSSEPGVYTEIIRGTVEGFGHPSFELFVRVEVQWGRKQDGHAFLDPGIIHVSKRFESNLSLPIANQKNILLEEYALKFLGESSGALQRKQRLEDPSPTLHIKVTKKDEGISYRLLALSLGREHFYIEVLCDFQRTLVSLKQSRIVFTEPLHVAENKTFSLLLRNHKLLSVTFRVERWFGADERLVEAEYRPPTGVLHPGEELPIFVTLMPSAPGFASDVFIPVYVEGLREPLLAQVTCLIRRREFRFSWHADCQLVSVVWPMDENRSVPQYPSEDSSSGSRFTERYSEESGAHVQRKEQEDSMAAVDNGSRTKERSSEVAEVSESTASSIPYCHWPLIGGRYYGANFTDQFLERDFEEPWTCESLNNKFRKLSSNEKEETISFFSKHALCFDIKTFEESSNSIEIHNESLQSSKYKAKVKFFNVKKNPVKLDPVEVAELQVYGRREVGVECPELIRRKWMTLIQDGVGLGITVRKKRGRIGGGRMVSLEVVAFSTAWGVYFDNVIVELEDVPKFNIPIFVRVTGNPLSFTFAPQEASPVLRFPSVMPNTMRQKTVLLKNESFLRLKVAWTMMSRPDSSQIEPDFSVQLELHPEQPQHFGRLHLIDYYGQQKARYYHICPRVLTVEPRSKAAVHILMDTAMASCNLEQLVRVLRATAVGTVYICRAREDQREPITDEYVACYRADGYDIDQIILTLETKLEVPNIRLINATKNDVTFMVRTLDIFSNETRAHSTRRKYILQNQATRAAHLKLHVSHPFRISKVLTKDYTEVPINSEIPLAVQELIEVEVTLTIRENFLYEESEDNTTYVDYGKPIRRDLICREKDYSEHVFPLYLEILKPKISISMNPVDFGEVFPLNTKESIVHVITLLGDEPYYLEMEKDDSDVFKILSPKTGLLKTGLRTNLIISFTPCEIRQYQCVIQLVTCTPGCEEEITLSGCCVEREIEKEDNLSDSQDRASTGTRSRQKKSHPFWRKTLGLKKMVAS